MISDLRKIKPALRDSAKAYRTSLTAAEKARLDHIIFNRLLSDDGFAAAALVLSYVSTGIEVDTRALISYALTAGKRVACPRCIPGTRMMDFIEISSPGDLKPGAFGVLEPAYDAARIIKDLQRSVCIVPGLAFDEEGYRLGYGKGYYDRFLSGYPGKTVGLCYSACVKPKLPHGKMDRAVGLLITDAAYRRVKG